MGLYDNTLGVLLIAIFLNTYFFGFVCYQYLAYFNAGFKDPVWIRVTVSLHALNDTVYSAAIIYMAWIYAVENYDNPLIFLSIPWPYAYTPIAIGISAILSHQFLVYRAFRLLGSRLVYVGIMTLSLGTFAGALTSGIKTWRLSSIGDVHSLKNYLYVWQGLQTATDLIVCCTLSYALYRSRTGFEHTDSVIYRLIRSAVQTGVFVVIFAMGHLISYILSPDTLIYSVFAACTGRMYSITLMDTLHCRSQLRAILSGPVDITPSMIRTDPFPQSQVPTSYQLSTIGNELDASSSDAENGPPMHKPTESYSFWSS
ncbi:hypothetical protein BDZ89DRAFT_414354 [Hymenopellis radicata]|nr:hypothetical protein BDZ89DRAFT_414354 [Hymenopellis radicata]